MNPLAKTMITLGFVGLLAATVWLAYLLALFIQYLMSWN